MKRASESVDCRPSTVERRASGVVWGPRAFGARTRGAARTVGDATRRPHAHAPTRLERRPRSSSHLARGAGPTLRPPSLSITVAPERQPNWTQQARRPTSPNKSAHKLAALASAKACEPARLRSVGASEPPSLAGSREPTSSPARAHHLAALKWRADQFYHSINLEISRCRLTCRCRRVGCIWVASGADYKLCAPTKLIKTLYERRVSLSCRRLPDAFDWRRSLARRDRPTRRRIDLMAPLAPKRH